MPKFIINSFFFLLLLCSAALVSAQETLVVGQVVDKYTQTPLASVDIYFKNSNVAVQSNEEGYFLIRNSGTQTTLVFSLLGYKKEQIRVKQGDSVGLQMELEEKDNYLTEVFVVPGANPANDLMKRVRACRKENNVKALINSTEQSAVFLSKKNFRRQNNRLFGQFSAGNLSSNDSSLLLPLYVEQSEYTHADNTKRQTAKDTYNTSKTVSDAVAQLLKGMDERLNFYENSVPVFGRSVISPLANVGGSFYNYYLTDSAQTTAGKQYEVRFRSINTKNLALNGAMWIDSASLALVKINAELPRQANLNFIRNFTVNQEFESKTNRWLPKSEQTHWNLVYEIIADSVNKKPELLISRSTVFNTSEKVIITDKSTFADTPYSQENLSLGIAKTNETPIFKFAKYVADVILTGYMKVGKFDVGSITSLARLTEQEGFRLTLPARTNETLWKNVMLGGMLGYGFGDRAWKYGADAQWQLPVDKRVILGAHYLNDYHWTTHDKNDFLWREDPIGSHDENIMTTIFSFMKGKYNSKRENISFFIQNDWNDDMETRWIVGKERFFGNNRMPLVLGSEVFPELKVRYATVFSRLSFNERVINEYFQRLYIYNHKPVIGITAETGKFTLGTRQGSYAHLKLNAQQWFRFMLGEWRYFAEAGKVVGDVPYPLLKFFHTWAEGGYNIHQFSLMNSFEYPMDTYAAFHSEVITNGIFFNRIPLIKHLNLRELFIFKIGYGISKNTHAQLLDYPSAASSLTRPYSEVGVGFTNLFRVFSMQSMWRLTDLKKGGIMPWCISFNLWLSF